MIHGKVTTEKVRSPDGTGWLVTHSLDEQRVDQMEGSVEECVNEGTLNMEDVSEYDINPKNGGETQPWNQGLYRDLGYELDGYQIKDARWAYPQ